MTSSVKRDLRLSRSRERPAKDTVQFLSQSDITPEHQKWRTCTAPRMPPTRATLAKARELFIELATPQHYRCYGEPEAILDCIGMKWGLHKSVLTSSKTLTDLYEHYKMAADGGKKHASEDGATSQVVNLKFDIDDSLVTPNAVAVVLSKLYRYGPEYPSNVNLAGVLVVAHVLKVVTWMPVEQQCKELMMSSINSGLACCYHEAALKTDAKDLAAACVAWLELNLVTRYSGKLQLRHLPLELLYQVVSSPRLFTIDEYALYKLLTSWLFLQLNPSIEVLPSYNTITTYFHSLSKTSAYLECDDGQQYVALFRQLHLHGLTDSTHVYNVQLMNVIPPQWMLKILAAHYHSLQAGGDMSTNISFDREAIRYGFIINRGEGDHSEKISIFGFHFELKSVQREDDGSYDFYIQRLKPSDPILSVHDNERQTFSLRPDRAMHYSIQVQYYDTENAIQRHSTGKLSHKFGLGFKTGTSKTVNMTDLQTPFNVLFSIMLPPS